MKKKTAVAFMPAAVIISLAGCAAASPAAQIQEKFLHPKGGNRPCFTSGI